MEGSALLQEWLRWAWVMAYSVIVVVHLRHALSKGGQRRAWHGVHIVMGLGMFYMFLSRPLKTVPGFVWEIGFAVVAAVILGWILRVWAEKRAVNFLWTISVFHMLAMVYMFALPEVSVAALTYVLAAYFVFESFAWLVGAFDDVGEKRRLLPFAIGPRSPESRASTQPLVGASPFRLRATLSPMAAGMAYMFFAMQLDM